MARTKIRPVVQQLEDRTVPATFVVNSIADDVILDAFTTLREAITLANSTLGSDEIIFNIPGTGVHTIALASALPTIIETVTIDATTQPGYLDSPLIAIDGTLAEGGTDGITLLDHTGSVIIGLAIHGFAGSGIVLSGGGNHTIIRNFIGTDATGTTANGNGGSGILITNGSMGNFIGGPTGIDRNLISGNRGDGVRITGIGTGGNAIARNFIGTAIDGKSPLGNGGNGVYITNGATNNVIGARVPREAANVISGNALHGVLIDGVGTDGNRVLGNTIGGDSGAMLDVGNGGDGVRIDGGIESTIGGELANSTNIILGNAGYGVHLLNGANNTEISNNYIGADLTKITSVANQLGGVFISGSANNTIGSTVAGADNLIIGNGGNGITIGNSPADTISVGNAILTNVIARNTGLGIDLGNDGLTPNGVNPRAFPNNGQNAPTVTSAIVEAGLTTILGTITSAPNASIRIELFASSLPDASGFGEGETYLGFLLVTTDSAGMASFRFTASALPVGQIITATATDSTTRDSSEFSGSTRIIGSQAITFPQTSPITVGNAPITLTATGGASGNAVTFTLISGPGTIAGNVLTITGAGTIVIAANQAGNADYLAAAQVIQTLIVNPAPIVPPVIPPVVPPIVPPVTRNFLTAVGSSVGATPRVTVFNADGTVRFTFIPFEETYLGGVRVAVAEVSGDGFDDIICWAGVTGGPRITIYDGVSGVVRANFFAFESTYRGGVNVIVANLDGVGPFELLATAGVGGGPVFAIIDGLGVKQQQIFIGPQTDRGGVMLTTNLGLTSLTTARGDQASAITSIGFARSDALIDPITSVDVAIIAGWFDGIGDPIGTLAGVFVG